MDIREADYRSPEFYDIIASLNSALTANNLPSINADLGKIITSNFSVGNYGNTKIWRITNLEYPPLMVDGIMDKIIAFFKYVYKDYINSRIIRLGHPAYTTNKAGQPMASIVIMLTELPDNIITRTDLFNFGAGEQSAIDKCTEIESRMFRRENDLRDVATRIDDFAFSLVYEPKLINTELYNVFNLTLKHQDEVVTLETDKETDFFGIINDMQVNIEGKSTKANVRYADTPAGHAIFADYFRNRLLTGSLGSIHKADYILFVLRCTGEVICINAANFEDNWLAGKIDL